MVGASKVVMPRSLASWAFTVRSVIGAMRAMSRVSVTGRAGVAEAGARGHADEVGGADELRGLAGEAGAGRAHPDVHRDGGRADAIEELGEAGVAHDDAGGVGLEHQAGRPLRLGVGDGLLDEVDQHRIEQAADLDHGDEAAGLGGLVGRSARWWRSCRRGSGRRRPPRGPITPSTTRTAPRTARTAPVVGSLRTECLRGEHGPCAVLRSITGAHRGREGGRRQKHRERHPGPGRGARRAVDPHRRGPGPERHRRPLRPAGLRLRRGRAASRRWPRGRGRRAGPPAHARRRPARVPRGPRPAPGHPPPALGRRPRRGGHRRPRHQGHPRARAR